MAKKAGSPSGADEIYALAWFGIVVYAIGQIIYTAYDIRMGAIKEYGAVIHEFDPYFNFRATEYLYEHGAKKFFQWFDKMAWYPLGRPVGTTIYPGMQFTAVFIKRYLIHSWSLNDICCYMPAWFGAIASIVTGMLAYECALPGNSSSNALQWLTDLIKGKRTEVAAVKRPMAFGYMSPAVECGVFALGMMAIVPAHLMRSIGGGYDNESIAVSAMVITFYCWVRSLRNDRSAWWGAAAALAYFYMVAAWGGYIFVLNMVGVHAAFLVAAGRFSNKVYTSYSLFYFIGTALAVQVPVVGWAPLKSLEQLGPCAVFLGYQVLKVCDTIKGKKKLSRTQLLVLRVKVFAAATVLAIVLIMAVVPKGYFGPLSSRVRGLFVKHSKTGNPLVDSVAEHQPASSRAYFQYLHHVCSLAPIGYITILASLSDASSFLIVWGAAAYFFSHKMVRLILLTAPIASILGGIAAGKLFAWCIRQFWESHEKKSSSATSSKKNESNSFTKRGKNKKGKKNAQSNQNAGPDDFTSLKASWEIALSSSEGVLVKRSLAALVIFMGFVFQVNFINYCWRLSGDLSSPTIIVKARLRDGRVIKVDDYRDAYTWLKKNTPEDARIMAWWDYGYQISGIANRTTLADGNTWNHEHIALLGKALTASEEEGYEIARHLADYVLIWGGGGGDDLAKSPHLARIANSVYRDHCPAGDTTCRAFGLLNREGAPSPMMERSLLYRLHSNKIKPDVEADPDKWREVYRTKYGRVRIYKILGVSQESKEWVEENRKCDAEGSWFCPGTYPPGLQHILSRKKDFAQLEDFNSADADEEYQKRYFEALNDPAKAARNALLSERREMAKKQKVDEKGTKEKADEIYNNWQDTEETTLMWNLIAADKVTALKEWLDEEPAMAFLRSKDGRGPMWWAFEQRNEAITKLLMKLGVPHTDKDSKGQTPADLLEGKA